MKSLIVRSQVIIRKGLLLVCFNGANDSAEATAIYRRWLQQNQNSDVITGIQAADHRKALVDEFRENASIMIATKATEGINL